MNPQRWQRLETLFRSAVELSPAERDAWLEGACDGDPDLHRDIEAMLAADSSPDAAVHGVLAGGFELLQTIPEPQRRLGPYRLLERIGEGGMGVVYRADRADDEYRKVVAIKLIRWGLEHPSQIERFRRERQILAELEHPGIARLLDGGTTPEGAPYLVMEHVDGEPIDRYCDRHGLSIEARLGLFLDVCSAVTYAHQHLVVHRDLKPSNILVTADGGVKLLDFGIAKLLVDEAATSATATVERALSLAYASPEQMRGVAVSTASDVYSLGVVLYELLAGRRPFELEGLSHAQVVERLDVEAALPSSFASAAAPSADEIARARDLSPARLRRRLTGDLDNIVMMALRKEPGRRYGAVDQLAEDLRRHLHGLPVKARKSTLAYRAGKFVRRHRLALTLVAACLAGVLALVAVFQERARMQQERDKAAGLAAFLVELFDASEPGKARGEELSARQILDRGAANIQRQFEGQPLLQAMLLDKVAQVYRKLGEYERARPMVEKALEIRRREGGNPGDEAESLRHLAHLFKADGHFDEAIVAYREALAILPDRRGDDLLRADLLNDLALVLDRQGQTREAETLLTRALEIYRKRHGDEHSSVATVIVNLVPILERRGQFDRAEPLMRRALAIDLKIFGEPHPHVADDLNSLAFILQSQGRFAEAEQEYRRALAMHQELLGAEHPRLLEGTNNLASVLIDRGDLTPARQLLEGALADFDALRQEGHPDIAPSLHNLALVEQYQGRYEAAEKLLREALDLRIEAFGEEHLAVAGSVHNLGVLHFTAGDYAAAEPTFHQALELRRKLVGDPHPLIAPSLEGLAMLDRVRGHHESAINRARQALAIRRQFTHDEHPIVARNSSLLGELLAAAGEVEEAETTLRRALELQRRISGPRHHELATTLTRLGALLTDLERADEADPLLREALDIRREVLPGHWLVAVTESALGACETARGRYPRAEKYLLDSHRTLLETRGAGNLRTRETTRRLAELYDAWGKPKAAARYRQPSD